MVNLPSAEKRRQLNQFMEAKKKDKYEDTINPAARVSRIICLFYFLLVGWLKHF